jgi:hypothetical protein
VDVRFVRPVTVVLAWLLLVAGVAAGSWFAVDAAVRAVGAPAAPADVVLPAPGGASPTSSSTPGPSGTPSSTRSPGATPAASPSASVSPSPGERKTFDIQGGGLVVRCEGTTLAYWAVRLAAGWRVNTSQKSASVVEATSIRPGGASTVVAVTCRASGPESSLGGGSPAPTP